MRRLERADGGLKPRDGVPAQDRPSSCTPYVKLKLVIPCESKCEALLQALRPDDKTAPHWMLIREEIVEGKLVVEIFVELHKIKSLRATAEEILEYSYSLLKTLEVLEKTAEGYEEKRSPS